MRLIPTRYFEEDQLKPGVSRTESPLPILSEKTIQKIQKVTHGLHNKAYVEVRENDLNNDPDLAMFIAFLRFFGAVEIIHANDVYHISIAGPLAKDLPYVISLYLIHGFSIFDDWSRRYRTLSDQISSLEFLHQIELQRIKRSKQIGIFPEITREVPVSFAIIKAYSRRRGKAVYLLELNKDWNRYNLIGGKQQPMDNFDYRITCLREMEEELGLPRSRVLLTPLTNETLKGYSLSGSRGALSYYPCMLYWARIKGPLTTRAKDAWFTEEEILELQKTDDPGLMINHIYLDFLFHKLPHGLEGLDYSLDEPIEEDRWYYKARDFIVKHKVWIIPLLAIIAGIIKIVSNLLK